MKNRSLPALLASGLLLATVTLALAGCAHRIYLDPEYNYSGRVTPPSGLLQRVMASYSSNGSSGGLAILDGLRDLRSNIQNTIKSFGIAGYSEGTPADIINFPEQEQGYVFSTNDGTLTSISYAKESSNGSVGSYGAGAPSAAAADNGTIFAGALETSGGMIVTYNSVPYSLNLPNVDKVVIDQGNSVVLAMVRNSNALYRVVKLPTTSNPVIPPGSVDCEPLLLPVLCVVPVAGTYDHPVNASFSLDGSTAYILNSGPENSGTTASVTFLQMSALNILNVPTINPLDPTAPSPMSSLPVANPIPIPGGVTAAVSDGTYLYLAGQQLQTSGPYAGLFAGNLTLLNLSTYAVSAPISISDGTHTRMLLADDGPGTSGTLWIGATQCANGVRAALQAAGNITQAANTNCLTRYVTGTNQVLPAWTASTAYTIGAKVTDGANMEIAQTGGTSGTATPAWSSSIDGTATDGGITWVNLGPVTQAQVIPSVTPNSTAIMPVSYPNTDNNLLYYGSLTGLCWVQNYGKVYTADGGQIHAFNTLDGGERNNFNITVQGTVLDVAYIDALSNSAN